MVRFCGEVSGFIIHKYYRVYKEFSKTNIESIKNINQTDMRVGSNERRKWAAELMDVHYFADVCRSYFIAHGLCVL